MSDVWTLVGAERAALLRDLGGLEREVWDRPSLCAGWTVHDVAAHLVDNARTTRLGFVVALARARVDFDRQNARGVQRERAPRRTDVVARFRLTATDTDFWVGDGPEVSGTALSLLLVISGRRAALGDLEGPGARDLVAHYDGQPTSER